MQLDLSNSRLVWLGAGVFLVQVLAVSQTTGKWAGGREGDRVFQEHRQGILKQTPKCA